MKISGSEEKSYFNSNDVVAGSSPAFSGNGELAQLVRARLLFSPVLRIKNFPSSADNRYFIARKNCFHLFSGILNCG